MIHPNLLIIPGFLIFSSMSWQLIPYGKLLPSQSFGLLFLAYKQKINHFLLSRWCTLLARAKTIGIIVPKVNNIFISFFTIVRPTQANIIYKKENLIEILMSSPQSHECHCQEPGNSKGGLKARCRGCSC
jgi:hypothetical protein